MIAEDLRSAQLGQTELLEHLLTNMRIAQALADKQTAAAANLQAMVDDVAERYRETAFAAGADIWGCGVHPQSATFEASVEP
ncbi:hypothetical protein CBS115989_8025 [Aspergillus niger]|nr:hypothetical protein CBS115989_8025 [Aspergillus niger]KAI2818773.1 hypothetical protein CBS133816_10258 [Aspergillus niger]KAI2838770.1 hypothetical protein CBS12448_10818 [Aspergillus niger]KAI2843129.1 hypothetical protein CBS11350_5408 [Aspergillus niger]KAI2846797.1 hypothetical protein CBS11232_7297 [Aspergillus niger]